MKDNSPELPPETQKRSLHPAQLRLVRQRKLQECRGTTGPENAVYLFHGPGQVRSVPQSISPGNDIDTFVSEGFQVAHVTPGEADPPERTLPTPGSQSAAGPYEHRLRQIQSRDVAVPVSSREEKGDISRPARHIQDSCRLPRKEPHETPLPG